MPDHIECTIYLIIYGVPCSRRKTSESPSCTRSVVGNNNNSRLKERSLSCQVSGLSSLALTPTPGPRSHGHQEAFPVSSPDSSLSPTTPGTEEGRREGQSHQGGPASSTDSSLPPLTPLTARTRGRPHLTLTMASGEELDVRTPMTGTTPSVFGLSGMQKHPTEVGRGGFFEGKARTKFLTSS